MIHIKYRLDKSNKHGIGLFTEEDLKKGQLIYTASPLLDVNLTEEQFNSLSDLEKDEIRWWGFFHEPSKRWHVDFDVSKFINHSYKSNITQDENFDEAHLITARIIKAGEELTQNYLEFESESDLMRRGISSDSNS